MVQLPDSFNPGQHKGIDNFEPVPPAWYPAQITDSKMKNTKNGLGQYLELTWSVLGGEFNKRRIWQRLNLRHPNPETVEISQKFLKSICDACGVPGPVTDTVVLHGRPSMIKVTKIAATSEYPEGNDIRGHKPLDDPSVAGAQHPAQPGVPGQPSLSPAQAAMQAASGQQPAPQAQPAPEQPAQPTQQAEQPPIQQAPPAEQLPPADGGLRPPWVK